MYYILRNRRPVRIRSVLAWAEWFEKADRTVANTVLVANVGGEEVARVRISTVFLGLDHNWGSGRPLLFETMIFGGPLNEQCWRTATWNEAQLAHRHACAAVDALQTEAKLIAAQAIGEMMRQT